MRASRTQVATRYLDMKTSRATAVMEEGVSGGPGRGCGEMVRPGNKSCNLSNLECQGIRMGSGEKGFRIGKQLRAPLPTVNERYGDLPHLILSERYRLLTSTVPACSVKQVSSATSPSSKD